MCLKVRTLLCVLAMLILIVVAHVSGQSKLICEERMAQGCINSTLGKRDRDVVLIENGQLQQTVHDMYCSLVFNLRLSKLECIDESMHGCNQAIKQSVNDRYDTILKEFQSKCARTAVEPGSRASNTTVGEGWSCLMLVTSALMLFAHSLFR